MVEYAFIHIPKNAGESFRDGLAPLSNIKYFSHSVEFKYIENLKKIYVLREPIDRFTSAFFYLTRYNKNKAKEFFKSPDQLLSAVLDLDGRAMGFFKIHEGSHFIYGQPIPTDWAFSKQSDWIIDPFKILYYERLDKDLDALGNLLGEKIQLPHKHASLRIDFSYSEDHINLLKLIYKKDFELYDKYITDTELTFYQPT